MPSAFNVLLNMVGLKPDGSTRAFGRMNRFDDFIMTLGGSEPDVFGGLITGMRANQIQVDFSRANPDALDEIICSYTGGASSTRSQGHGVFSLGTTSGAATVNVVTKKSLRYIAMQELFAGWTATFSTPAAGTYQRIGPFTDTDGWFVGYEGTTFQLTHRRNTTDTPIFQSAFEFDKLDGNSPSRFYRAGVREAINQQLSNVYRVRFGWFGSAVLILEVYTPDGRWLPVHIMRFPNLIAGASITTPALPMRLQLGRSGGTTNLQMQTGCWAAGSTASNRLALAGLSRPLTQRIAIGTSPIQLDSTKLVDRASFEVFSLADNSNNQRIYVGFGNGVNSSNGRPVENGTPWAIDLTEDADIWAVASSGTLAVQFTQVGH